MSADRNILLRRRVAERCRELGTSTRAVLKAAGLSHDVLHHPPGYGHRVDTLEKLAKILGWDLTQLLAHEDEDQTSGKRRRDLCIACGRELVSPLICWSRTDDGFALPFHVRCLQSIATALTLRAHRKTRWPRPATNGTVSGIDIDTQGPGGR